MTLQVTFIWHGQSVLFGWFRRWCCCCLFSSLSPSFISSLSPVCPFDFSIITRSVLVARSNANVQFHTHSYASFKYDYTKILNYLRLIEISRYGKQYSRIFASATSTKRLHSKSMEFLFGYCICYNILTHIFRTIFGCLMCLSLSPLAIPILLGIDVHELICFPHAHTHTRLSFALYIWESVTFFEHDENAMAWRKLNCISTVSYTFMIATHTRGRTRSRGCSLARKIALSFIPLSLWATSLNHIQDIRALCAMSWMRGLAYSTDNIRGKSRNRYKYDRSVAQCWT